MFQNEAHEAHFHRLLEKYQAYGQENERLSSLYVLSALPDDVIAAFEKKPYIDFHELTEHVPSDYLPHVRFASELYHMKREMKLYELLGSLNPLRDLALSALTLHYKPDSFAY